MRDTSKRRDSSGGQPASLCEALLTGYLSQLWRSYQNRAFIGKGLFSGVLFFSLGLNGVLPVFHPPAVDTATYGEPSPADQQEASQKINTERCRLEEDVRLFQVLREGESVTFQSEVPCERALVSEMKTGKEEQLAGGRASLEKIMREMVVGYPLEAMVPAIAEYDRTIAALIVGIAKKESDWGKNIPLDANGTDCFNYWGYKGAGTRGTAMGYGCFGNPEEAVTAIGERLKTLVALLQGSEPKNMVVWKCGSSCKGHSDASVKKWIADVSLYYDRIAVQ